MRRTLDLLSGAPVVPVVDLSRRGRDLADGVRATSPDASRRSGSVPARRRDRLRSSASSRRWARRARTPSPSSSGASALQLALAAVGVGAGDEVIVPAFTAVPDGVGGRAHWAPHRCRRRRRRHGAHSTRTAGRGGPHRAHAGGDRRAPVRAPGRAAGHRPRRSSRTRRRRTARCTTTRARPPSSTASTRPRTSAAIGDGGAVVTDDADVADAVRLLRVHGMTEQYVHTAVSQNFRMSEIEAAWLRLALAELARRQRPPARDRRALPRGRARSCAGSADHPDHVLPPRACFAAADATASAAALAARRRRDRRALPAGAHAAAGIPAASTTPPCPQAEAWAAECVTVPCFPEMTDDEVETVAVGARARWTA